MVDGFKNTPMSIRAGVLVYLAIILAGGVYLALEEMMYAIPVIATGLIGAFFAIYQQGRMTVISALLGLTFNLVLLFGVAAEEIFMAIQNGQIPNLHYGLPLVVGLFGYMLGQVNQLFYEGQTDPNGLPENVRIMRPGLPSKKDLAELESQISSTVSRAIADGIAEGLSEGLQNALQPNRTSVERKSA
ncbi:MAG: hypothetical protein HQM13_16505 [SAR324 cluster bacterium]|nr:hypothetical protein [SAR324 cluster bacterium]